MVHIEPLNGIQRNQTGEGYINKREVMAALGSARRKHCYEIRYTVRIVVGNKVHDNKGKQYKTLHEAIQWRDMKLFELDMMPQNKVDEYNQEINRYTTTYEKLYEDGVLPRFKPCVEAE